MLSRIFFLRSNSLAMCSLYFVSSFSIESFRWEISNGFKSATDAINQLLQKGKLHFVD